MRQKLIAAYDLLVLFGLDPLRMINMLRGMPGYFRDFRTLLRQHSDAGVDFPRGRFYPCLQEKRTQSGSARGHYFHQDLLIARKIFASGPQKHVDVGSRIDGFVAHVATFRPIEVVDIRPLSSYISNVQFLQCDVMGNLPQRLLSYCDSLSCLHALEHFGLGRYGDPVCFNGHAIGFRNLTRMLRPNGKLYFSVPIGPLRIEFNAHRVFSMPYLLELIEPGYRIEAFSFVDDKGDLHDHVSLDARNVESNFGCQYGCGIFELIKND